MRFRRRRYKQTPKLVNVGLTMEGEIAYWWLRDNSDFSVRQVLTKPDVFYNGKNPRDYPEIAAMMSQNTKDRDGQSIPDAMRLGLILQAYCEGCRDVLLLNGLRDEFRLQESMLRDWEKAIEAIKKTVVQEKINRGI